MKHRIYGKKLGRNTRERKALFNSLVRAIFTHGYFQTTEAKAQSVIKTIEGLSNTIMTKPDLMARRELFRYLQDQHWVNQVFTAMKSTFEGQFSNFTKITKIKRRYGDDALVVKMEFIKEIKFAKAPEKTEEKVKEVKKVKAVKKAPVKKTVAKETEIKEIAKKPVKKTVKKETK